MNKNLCVNAAVYFVRISGFFDAKNPGLGGNCNVGFQKGVNDM